MGDEIVLYELESILGISYLYKKLRLDDYTRLKIGKTEIDIKNDGINLISGSSQITIHESGSIDISVSDTNTINIDGGTINLDANTLSANSGTVIPTGVGPFCAITTCPYTGMPHVGNISKK